MELSELQKRFPDATEDTWHRHPNGGGWVQNTAVVEETAYIGKYALVYWHAKVYGRAEVGSNAKVYGYAKVHGNAEVYGDARVCGYAEVYGNAAVHGHAKVHGDAEVYGHAEVHGNAEVHGHAEVYGDARVYGDAEVYGCTEVYVGIWSVTPFCLKGTRHAVQVCSPNAIAIGCEVRSIDYWLELYEMIGEENGYTKEQIVEYGEYIKLIARLRDLGFKNVIGG